MTKPLRGILQATATQLTATDLSTHRGIRRGEKLASAGSNGLAGTSRTVINRGELIGRIYQARNASRAEVPYGYKGIGGRGRRQTDCSVAGDREDLHNSAEVGGG